MASLWPIKELTDQYCRLDSHFKWTKKWGAIHHLTLYVRLPVYETTILERMDRVIEPFNDELSTASGFLLITTDLRPPLDKV